MNKQKTPTHIYIYIYIYGSPRPCYLCFLVSMPKTLVISMFYELGRGPDFIVFFYRIQSAVLFVLHLARATRTFPQHHACGCNGKQDSSLSRGEIPLCSFYREERLLLSREEESLYSIYGKERFLANPFIEKRDSFSLEKRSLSILYIERRDSSPFRL